VKLGIKRILSQKTRIEIDSYMIFVAKTSFVLSLAFSCMLDFHLVGRFHAIFFICIELMHEFFFMNAKLRP
jgi:hypothetical protein